MAATREFAWIGAAAAGLMGAAGVGLAAFGAHADTSPLVAVAANFLLFHASAILALCALGLAAPRPGGLLAAAGLLIFGGTLFCGDLAARALLHGRLFAMAAPIGGGALILGWLVAALAAALAFWRGRTISG